MDFIPYHDSEFRNPRRFFDPLPNTWRVQHHRVEPKLIDSIASTAYISIMSTTLTIRNLGEPIKQKLRMQAAENGRSMEAEAREILARGVEKGGPVAEDLSQQERMKQALDSLSGIWKGRGNTDEMMRELRGED